MALRCLTGHIGYGGVIYATGDVFDIDSPTVEQSLIDDGDAELVENVVIDDSKESTNDDAIEDASVKNTRKKAVNRR